MDIHIELPLNSIVLCQDGEVGESIELVIDPEDRQLTHLVVLEKSTTKFERLVPISLISGIQSDRITLSCSKAEFKKLDLFCERDVILQQHESPISDHKVAMYNFPVTRRVIIENKSIPEGKLAFDEETTIEATDVRVGKLEKFLIAAESGKLSHLVMRSSAVFGKREVIVPVSAIDSFTSQRIHLNISKKELKELSGVAVIV